MGAGLVDGFVPSGELAVRVAAAAVKGLTFAGAASDQLTRAAFFGTGNTEKGCTGELVLRTL